MNETQEITVGSIFKMSWGYDQTNVQFFQVTKVTKSGVCVREIASQTFNSEGTGSMAGRVKPFVGGFLASSQWCGSGNPSKFKRIKGDSFNFQGRYFARLTDVNASHYQSWYA